MSIRRFLRYDLEEATPGHSSLSVIRNRLPLEVHEEAFSFSLRPLRKAGLLVGENIGLDSSTMEANASLEKLTRREDGKTYRQYAGELAAEAAGIDPEDTAAVADFDRRRKDKKVCNDEWFSPNDPDASIGPRKDGAWDMIHKVENAVDLDSGAILSVEIQPATKGDAENMAAHFETAAAMVEYTAAQLDEEDGAEDGGDGGGKPDGWCKPMAVADKGYHKKEELAKLVKAGFEPNVAEPAGRTVPKRNSAQAFEANRKNRKSDAGRELMRRRGEKVERSFRHLLDHAGGRRTTLSGHVKIAKRLLVQALAFNLSIHSWHVNGVGTVKQYAAGNLNGEVVPGLAGALDGLVRSVRRLLAVLSRRVRPDPIPGGHIRNEARQPFRPRHQFIPA